MEKLTLQRINGEKAIPEDIKELYMGAFPEEERRPWSDIEERVRVSDPFFFFFLIQWEGKPAGFATVWRLPGATYVEHFAVFSSLRGRGVGARVVGALLDDNMRGQLGLQPGTPLVLEVELPEKSEEATRRVGFYRRCGLHDMADFPYYQPPYTYGLPDVPMMLMTSAPLSDAEGFVIMLHNLVYNQ